MPRSQLILAAVVLLLLGAADLAEAETSQRGNLRVTFTGGLTPRTLPRSGAAPVGVTVGGTIATTNGASPPRLRRITIAVNRYGRFAPAGLPVCRIEQIQPSTTEDALRACRRSLVGTGNFSANVLLPEQAPFPADGKVFAFNGFFRGHPAILAHVYGTDPAPISYTLPFQINRTKGTFGTVIVATLPEVTGEWGYVTGLEMTLQRRFTYRGRSRSYVSAGCPAPDGFPGAVFPFVRASFDFGKKYELSSTLVRSCKAQG